MIKYIKRTSRNTFCFFILLSILLSFSGQANLVKAADKDNQIITITGSNFVADSFNGVDALYRTGGSDGSNETYSCAAYVKRYYKEIYGVNANNFFHGRTPKSDKDSFLKVSKPQVGDIAAMDSSSTSTHWAIVKEVNKSSITLIEQNWKWSQDGKYVTKINRTISINDARYYRLSSVNQNIEEIELNIELSKGKN
jgi:hypothetical protein